MLLEAGTSQEVGIRKYRGEIRGTFLCLMLLLISNSSSWAQFKSIETEHGKIIYFGLAQEYLISHIARCFENAHRYHENLYKYQATEKTVLFVNDLADYGNAGAGVLPWNHISLGIAPLNYAFETSPANERMNATLNHEVVHLVASDKTSPKERFFRSLFLGKVSETADAPLSILYAYLTAPRRSAPRWYHEGIAVFMETWMAGGLGRALSPYDEMYFRTKVHEGSPLHDPISLEAKGVSEDFQAGVNSYLYGTRFMSWLALRFGPKALIQWTDRHDTSAGYFASEFERVYGMSLEAGWRSWVQFEQKFQRRNLDSVSQHHLTPFTPLTTAAVGSVSRAVFDSASGSVIMGVHTAGEAAYLAAFDLRSGKRTVLCEVRGGAVFYVTSLTFDPTNRVLYFTEDNNDYRDIVSYDLKSRKKQVLIRDERIGDLAFNGSDRSLWGVRHFNGISTIVRIPVPYREWRQVYSWPYGKDLYDIDLSPSGCHLTGALSEASGRHTLILQETSALLEGDTSFQVLYDFGNSIPQNFNFSHDGSTLNGASFYTGVSNVFAFRFSDATMRAYSNCETGFFQPVTVSSDTIFCFKFTSQGFQPGKIGREEHLDITPIRYLGQEVVDSHPIVRDWIAPPPSSVVLGSDTQVARNLSLIKSTSLASLYPVLEGYKHHAAIGLRANFAGEIGIPSGHLSLSFSPTQFLPLVERLHVNTEWNYLNWTVGASHNQADFYDLFGPTRSSRKGTTVGVTRKAYLLSDPPVSLSYSVSGAAYWGFDKLPLYQNVTNTYESFQSLGGNLTYSKLESTIGAVDYEWGASWSLNASVRYVNSELFTRAWLTIDKGFRLPVAHTSLWTRIAAGFSPGPRGDILSDFYFGGFGNNWIDHESEKRYRAYYSFPGVELNEIDGKSFARMLLELNLPPVRFHRAGISSMYATWVRPALFIGAIGTDLEFTDTGNEYVSAGVQLDLRLTLLSHLRTTLSAGYAVAGANGVRPQTESMVSLKIL